MKFKIGDKIRAHWHKKDSKFIYEIVAIRDNVYVVWALFKETITLSGPIYLRECKKIWHTDRYYILHEEQK